MGKFTDPDLEAIELTKMNAHTDPGTGIWLTLKILSFDLYADLDPDFPSGADPCPASKLNADPDPATLIGVPGKYFKTMEKE
jgi:hypothetical protein